MKRFISTEDLQEITHCNYKESLSDAEEIGRLLAPFGYGDTMVLLGSIALIQSLRDDVESLRNEIEGLQSVTKFKYEEGWK